MKNLIKIGLPIFVFVFSFVYTTSTRIAVTLEKSNTYSVAKLEIPENIQNILDKSCVMCHNSESKDIKGKMKLNLDHFTDG